MASVGSMLGTKALQIFDETTCVVRAVRRWTQFYAHESCGKCTPCREGTYWLAQIYERLETGRGTEEDIDKLLDISDTILGKSFCALGDGAARPIISSIKYFRDEYEAHLARRLPVRPVRLDADRTGRGRSLMIRPRADTTARHPRRHSRLPQSRLVHARPSTTSRSSVPKGTLGDPRRRAARRRRSRGSATTRCSTRSARAGSAWSRSRASASRWPAAPPPSPRAWWCAPSTPREAADKAQHGVMELLLINHPLDCPVCDKGGECPLQNQAMSNGRAETRFADVKRTFPKPINISSAGAARPRALRAVRALHPVLRPDRRRPVHRRCWNAGASSRSASPPGEPFDSYFSGNTVQICPVGALTGAAYRFRARPFDLVSSPSVCEHCASGCAQRTDHRRGGRAAPAGRRRPGGQRGVELRQGPLGVHLRHASATGITTPLVRDDDGGLRAGLVVGGHRGGRRRPDRPRRDRRAGRRPGHRRGRLRLRQVRPNGAGHQRHRLPRPPALGGGGAVPGRPRRRAAGIGRATPTWRRRRWWCWPGSSRGGVADRLPAAAQGGPQTRAARGVAVAPFASRGSTKLARPA